MPQNPNRVGAQCIECGLHLYSGIIAFESDSLNRPPLEECEMEKGFNAFRMAQEQFDKVADQLDLGPTTRDLLRTPMREYHVSIPVWMMGL